MITKTPLFMLSGLVLVLAWYFYTSHIKNQNELLRAQVKQITSANFSLQSELNATRKNYLNEINALKALNNKKQTEIRYVTRFKERIIKDDNASCVSTTSAIFERLHSKNTR